MSDRISSIQTRRLEIKLDQLPERVIIRRRGMPRRLLTVDGHQDMPTELELDADEWLDLLELAAAIATTYD